MERETNTRTASFKEFFQLIQKTRVSKPLFIGGILLSFIGTIGSLIVPLLTQSFIDGFNTEMFTTGIVILIITVFIISAVIDGVAYYLLAKIGQTMIKTLREIVWKKFLRLPVSYFDQTKSGESVSRLVNDTATLKDLITTYFPQMINGVLSILGSVIILFILDWKMTLIMFTSVPLALVIILPLGKKMGGISKRLQDETAAFTGASQEVLSHIRLMRSYNAENFEVERGKKGINELYKYGMKEAVINALLSPIMSTLMMVVIVLIIVYGGLRVADGSMSMGTMVAFLLYLFQIIMPMTMFAMFYTQLNKTLGATARIIEILNHKETPDLGTLNSDTLSFNSVTFDDVHFQYEKNNPVLKGMTFKAEPNQKTAFVGPSGSGKSTIFSLIERYYEVTQGTILIDGVDIRNIPLSVLHQHIGYVAQESALFSGTIRDNITYGMQNEFSDAEIMQAVKSAYADEFINEMDDGLDTEVGERGIKLSGGQKQRINIARAFLKSPDILILDEATASLDSHSEHMVQQALDKLMAGRTVLVIAHRLSTITNSERIYFVEDGTITGSGTHEQLLKDHEMYQSFMRQQRT